MRIEIQSDFEFGAAIRGEDPRYLLGKLLEELIPSLVEDLEPSFTDEGVWKVSISQAANGVDIRVSRKVAGRIQPDLQIVRRFNVKTGVISHSAFTIRSELQGKNLADRVMRLTLDVVDGFKKWGKGPRISVHANLDVGGYAWLRKGFIPEDAEYLFRHLSRSSKSPELAAELYGLVQKMNPEEMSAFFLSDDFRKYKPALLGSDWGGSADPFDSRVRAALLGKSGAPVVPEAGTPSTVDIAIRRQVLIERFKAGEVAGFDETLAGIDADLRRLLSGGNLTEFRRARALAQLDELQNVLKGRYSAFVGQSLDGLKDYTDDEIKNAGDALDALLAGAGPEVAVPALEQVWATVTARPLGVRGASGDLLLEGFMREWGDADANAIVSAVHQGYFEGQTNQEILNRVRGTRAAGYSDGLLAVSRRHAEAVVRTVIQHTANVARGEVYAANEDIVEGYKWVATLDSRTSPICRSLDGQTFKIGQGPLPPAHVNCRSATVPILHPALAELSDGATRASKDGYVPGDLTYYEWLKQQDAEFQDLALGPTRGKLLRDGGLSAEKFSQLNLSRSFEPLTIEEMRRLNPKAFKRAGL